MKLSRLALLALATTVVAQQAHAQTTTAGDIDAAATAWDRGDYITALEIHARLLGSPSAARHLEAIALQTGELYHTTEITPDGRAPRISADGRYVAYESGAGDSSVLRIVSVQDAGRTIAELKGRNAIFAPTGARVAYLRTNVNDEVIQARAELRRTQPRTSERARADGVVEWLEAKNTVVIVRDLRTGVEAPVSNARFIAGAPVWDATGRRLYFASPAEGAATRNAIAVLTFADTACTRSRSGLRCAEATVSEVMSEEPGYKTAPRVVGRFLLYEMPAQAPLRDPALEVAADTPAAGGRGGPGGGGGAPAQFGVLDIESGASRVFTGSGATFSADGSTLAYLARSGTETRIMVVALPGGEPRAVKTTTERLAAAALSPDGRQVVFQLMPREDWELYLIGTDGTGERRLTREIQHDLAPRFLTATRVLAVIGEGRHRRSHLYDVNTLERTRLFHNNSVRTIAPEYEWSASADGSKILIVAERDGDTVSPERGVYVMDLSRRVTPAEVLDRVRASLAAEISLRDRGIATFRPIADDVRRVTEQVSIGRIYGYEKALFDFDSKHITRPGNAPATEYLFDTYRSFGYEPEYQWFEPRGAIAGKTANVLATLRGTENPELVYIVSSHFDSHAQGPGADDNTSGTAALLDAARVLAKHPMPATIIFASFTGEESGLLGSREWVRQAVANRVQLVGALNNDMLGWSNDHRLDNTIRYSNPGIRDIQHAAAAQFSKMITYDALYYKSTDAAAYYEAYGDIVGGIGSYPVLGNPHYHQSHDVLETINHELVTEASRTTVATLMLLASSPSRLKDLRVTSYAGRVAQVSWTPGPEKGITSYIVMVTSPAGDTLPRVTVSGPSATLRNVAPGSVVAVKAVNARGLEGWDWARVVVGGS